MLSLGSMRYWLALLLALSLWLTPLAPALAATVTREAAIEVINDLEAREVITPPVAARQRRYYQTHADPGLWSKLRGVVTFANVIWAIASVLLLLALAWLGGIYLIALLALIPLIAYEALAYLISGAAMVLSPGEFGALPGCLGLAGCLAWTHGAHAKTLEPRYQKLRLDPWTVCTFLLTLAWGACTIWQESQVLGFITVIMLEAFLGFAIAFLPGLYTLGFTSKTALPRAVFTSFALICFYIPLHQGWWVIPFAPLFQPGVLFVGTFVYFIGLLIWSSRWYGHSHPWVYVVLQGLTIFSGLAAVYGGGILQIQQFQAIGGTFFVLYLLEKYAEIPWQKEWAAWGLLGLALLLGGIAWLMRTYPQYFLI